MLKKEDIEKLAQLARLNIPDNEKESLRKEVDSILGYVGEIQKISGSDIGTPSGTIKNVMRNDGEPHISGEFTEELIASAPRRQDNFVKVKKIL
jgi:aspartyl-tRNA(Asn)/glutamyl-tRNA(Gln) amidotransferase subunit C